jgi:hypothetical protein
VSRPTAAVKCDRIRPIPHKEKKGNKNYMRIIGITGNKGSGKNTFAEFLKKEIEVDGKTAELASWAYLLKKLAFESFGIDTDESPDEWADRVKNTHVIHIINELNYFEGASKSEHSIDFRTFFQRLGTQGCRNIFGEDFWVDVFWDDFKKNKEEYPNYLIFTDTRFDNEAISVISNDGVNVKIVRDTDIEFDNHESEQGINKKYVSMIIDNDSGLEELNKSAIEYYRWLTEWQ